MEEILQHLGCMNTVNNGIFAISTSARRISEPSTTSTINRFKLQIPSGWRSFYRKHEEYRFVGRMDWTLIYDLNLCRTCFFFFSGGGDTFAGSIG